MLAPSDLQALWLTLRLAAGRRLLLLLIGTPLAWWLARTRSRLKGPVGAVVALPLVLPPTVLGFYLLLAMGPQRRRSGQLTQALGLGPLPFTFWRPGDGLGALFAALRGAAAAGRFRGDRRAPARSGRHAARRAAGSLLHRRAAAGATRAS